MKIAVLSGKGGTGKTLVTVNLAALKNSSYIDCDIEEPNGYLFFKPKDIEVEDISVRVPQVDRDLCNGCKKCVDFCRFNALAYARDSLIIFEDICHSCGGCMLICPENALSEKDRLIGRIEKGRSENVELYTGILNPGQPSGVPIIERLVEMESLSNKEYSLIDSPPGSACIVMESIKDADYCVLVAEPTIFGAHNLSMVYDLVKLFKKPFGVILNKSLEGENPSEDFCRKKKIKTLGSIPFDHDLGHLNSNGKIAVRESKKYKDLFSQILDKIIEEVENERNSNP